MADTVNAEIDSLCLRLGNALMEHKGKDIRILDFREHSFFVDYFLICTAGSVPQMQKLTDEIRKTVKEEGGAVASQPRDHASGWALLDLGDMLVHIFLPETREFYDIESLWNDVKTIKVE